MVANVRGVGYRPAAGQAVADPETLAGPVVTVPAVAILPLSANRRPA